jgi:DNA-binding winged helix-turn-helix (wHTH) protein/tetratricopeptide (TPR) repeat protein
MAYTFGDCAVDPSCFELRRRGRLVKLEPKVFDVLLYLIEHRDRVVTKQELLDAQWRSEAVSDSVLPRCIAAIRRAVGDTRTRQRVIATAHGRGYRFVAPMGAEPASQVLAAEGTARGRESSSSAAPPIKSMAGDTERPSDFVGRSGAMERLGEALERTRRGQGGVALIAGEPGIGKTRLAEEFGNRAQADGFEVLVGRCYEGDGAPAYWPWVQILRAAADATLDDTVLHVQLGSGAAELAELVPDLRSRVGHPRPPGGPGGNQARVRLYDAAARYLLERGREHPLVLVIDDLHWADASSLGLLRFLARPASEARVLIVGTYRDVDVRRGHPLADLLGALAREARCQRVALAGLGQSEIAEFVENLAGEVPRASLVSRLTEMTEGNPFFLREMVRLLADQGHAGDAEADALNALTLPQGVRDAIGRRLDALSPECNMLLRAAATLGRDFPIAMVESMLDLPSAQRPAALPELLAAALDAGVIVEATHGHFAFAHALTRQTLYEELRAPQRVALHRRAAAAIEKSLDPAAGNEEHLAELAHHFFEAAPGGDVDRAVSYAVAAAEASHRTYAYDEAVALYERAIDVIALRVPMDEEHRAELLLALGQAQFIAGKRDDALPTLRAAADLARTLGRVDVMAKAAIAIRGFGELGTPPGEAVLELLHEALELLPPDAFALRASLLSRLNGAAAMSMDQRGELAQQALEMAERSGDPVALRDALGAQWWATLGPDRLHERADVARSMRALAEQTGDPRTLLLALECEIGTNLLRGDFAATERGLDEYERTAAELGQPIFIFMGMNYRTSWLINRGRFGEAEARVEAARRFGAGIVPFAETVCLGQLYWSRSGRGLEPEFKLGPEDLKRFLSHTFVQGPIEKAFQAALSYSADGDPDRAIALLEGLDLRSVDRDEHWLLAVTTLAEIAVDAGHRELLEWMYEALAPYADLMAIHDLLRAGHGSVSHTLGAVATALGELDAAVGFLERAIEQESAADMRRALAASRLSLALALRRRGRRSDRERASELIRQGERDCVDLGLGPRCRPSGLLRELRKESEAS